jgi:hypothetical protein
MVPFGFAVFQLVPCFLAIVHRYSPSCKLCRISSCCKLQTELDFTRLTPVTSEPFFWGSSWTIALTCGRTASSFPRLAPTPAPCCVSLPNEPALRAFQFCSLPHIARKLCQFIIRSGFRRDKNEFVNSESLFLISHAIWVFRRSAMWRKKGDFLAAIFAVSTISIVIRNKCPHSVASCPAISNSVWSFTASRLFRRDRKRKVHSAHGRTDGDVTASLRESKAAN